jgi:hypothetical protein
MKRSEEAMTREPDIVERLRHRAKSLPPATTEELLEGAAEIERLRREIGILKALLAQYH